MTFFGDAIFKSFQSMNKDIFQTMEDQKVDESIDNYFASLDKRDRTWSIKEEENAREMLGVDTDRKIMQRPKMQILLEK